MPRVSRARPTSNKSRPKPVTSYRPRWHNIRTAPPTASRRSKGVSDVKYINRAKEVIQIEIDALQSVSANLNGGFSDAVRLILETLGKGGKVVVTGMGKSLHIGQKIASTMTSTGTPATVLHPSEAMHGDLGILRANDILLALSYSGESDELIALLPIIKRRNIPVIAVTGNPDSSLA
ncbi:MAG: SIS domain-containing protein, partial [Spartobacteria bacterium]|nr:SIS domain-containing protein [Spartobacteria bacterium]